MGIYDRIAEAGAYDPQGIDDLRAALGNESVLQKLGEVLAEAGAKNTLTGVDLREGLGDANRRQGEVLGLLRAVDIITEGVDRDG